MKAASGIAPCVAVVGIVALWVPTAVARPPQPDGGSIPSNPKDWNKGGVVRETSTNGSYTDFSVWPTDPQGNNITGNDANGNAWPQTRRNIRRDEHTDFVVPPGRIGGRDVADWRQSSRTHSSTSNSPIGDPAGTNWLSIESVYFDAQTSSYYMDGIFDLLHEVYGDGQFLHVPDLFADTNNSGALDDGDVLHSLVDLRQFCANAPGFADNQTYQIVNGHVDALPGMMFSTTPFTFSAATGWDSGTPFTGDAATYSYHSLTSNTPEPGFACVATIAGLALTAVRRRRGEIVPLAS